MLVLLIEILSNSTGEFTIRIFVFFRVDTIIDRILFETTALVWRKCFNCFLVYDIGHLKSQ
jgi:hypothetical protein